MTTSRARFRALCALYLAGVVVVAVLVDRFADAFWPATVIAFAPRWVWGVPLALLVPAAIVWNRRLLVPLVAGAAIVLGPIMDLRIPVTRAARRLGGAPERDLRVMTYNVGGGEIAPEAVRGLMRELEPDVVALQERSFPLVGRDIPNLPYGGTCEGEQCLFSRFSLTVTDARDRADLLAQHGSGSIVRYELQTPRGPLQVINVHLATVRDGLLSVMHRAWRGAGELEANTRERALESEIARAWSARGAGPLLVMGDFNMPVESAIYRRSWGSLGNALSDACLGFCSTKHTRWHGIRIDHVLAGPGWEVLRAWVGPGQGGDHRPVFADLRWVGPPAP